MNSLNVCVLTGVLERPPLAVTADGKPQQSARFTLTCTELGRDGASYRLYVPVETYGQVATQCLTLQAGTVLAVDGKLKWRSYTDRAGEKHSGLAVLAREIRLLTPDAAHAAPAADAVTVG
jgi:single-stranded DNA-binding protein